MGDSPRALSLGFQTLQEHGPKRMGDRTGGIHRRGRGEDHGPDAAGVDGSVGEGGRFTGIRNGCEATAGLAKGMNGMLETPKTG